MALFKSADTDGLGSAAAEYDPHTLSSPQVFLLSMLVFLAIAAFVAAILYRQISDADLLRFGAEEVRPRQRALMVGACDTGEAIARHL